MTPHYGDPHEAAALRSLHRLTVVPGRPRSDVAGSAHEFHRRVAAVADCPFCEAAIGQLCRTRRGREATSSRAADRIGLPTQAAHLTRIDQYWAARRTTH